MYKVLSFVPGLPTVKLRAQIQGQSYVESPFIASCGVDPLLEAFACWVEEVVLRCPPLPGLQAGPRQW